MGEAKVNPTTLEDPEGARIEKAEGTKVVLSTVNRGRNEGVGVALDEGVLLLDAVALKLDVTLLVRDTLDLGVGNGDSVTLTVIVMLDMALPLVDAVSGKVPV